MNIQDHPAFKELTNALGQLQPDRRQELMSILANQSESILTVQDISGILEVHPLTVRRWIASGELRATRIKGYKINLIDFSMFLEGRKMKAQPEQRQ